jgi:hypothetical protein
LLLKGVQIRDLLQQGLGAFWSSSLGKNRSKPLLSRNMRIVSFVCRLAQDSITNNTQT